MAFDSEAQRRALYAAARGDSKLGIPKERAQRAIADAPGNNYVPGVDRASSPKSALMHEMKRRRLNAQDGKPR
jgi:hypothetical protein